jgi:hypothetical protein
MIPTLQTALSVALIAFLGQWRYAQFKRNRRSWDDVLSALQAAGWDPQDVRNLRAIFASAPFLVQLAEYATEHSTDPNNEILEGLRSDAFQIRLFAPSALAKSVLGRSNAAT